MGKVFLSITLILFFIFNRGIHSDTIPNLYGHILDEARLLSASSIREFESKLDLFSEQSKTGIILFTVKSIEDLPQTDLWEELQSRWGIGKENRTVVLFISKQDKIIKIFLTENLRDLFSEEVKNWIVKKNMIPNFKLGDYDKGIQLAIVSIQRAVLGEKVIVTEDLGFLGKVNLFFRIISLPQNSIPIYLSIPGMIVFLLIVGTHTITTILRDSGFSWFQFLSLVPFYTVFPVLFMGAAGLILTGMYLLFYPLSKYYFREFSKLQVWREETVLLSDEKKMSAPERDKFDENGTFGSW